MPRPPTLSDAKQAVLRLLKRGGPAPARAIAEALGTTTAAARQHLAALEAAGLVQAGPATPAASRGRGRPSVLWSLTRRASSFFADEHAELAVGLIDAIRSSIGERGLARVIEARARGQVAAYRRLAPSGASLEKRIRALARQRTAEGYMAEVVKQGRGEFLLVERHCPIRDAATACRGLCGAELAVFRATLGEDVEVERTVHLLSGGDRCAYRIRRRP